MSDPFDLARFVDAQANVYATALGEIRRGQKRSHWMWFVFPQLHGLGSSVMAQRYAIKSRAEATEYLGHPVLGARYRECVSTLQDLNLSDPQVVFGSIDALKLHSSLTLFGEIAPTSLYDAALRRWFGGERDPATIARLAQGSKRADSR